MNTRSLSLRFRLLILIVTVTLLFGGMGIFVLKRISDTVAQKELHSFQSYSLSLARSIEAQFFERYGDVQSFAESPLVKSRSREAAVPFLNRMVELYGIYDLILVIDETGKLIAVNSKGPDGKNIETESLYARDYSKTEWFRAVQEGKTSDSPEKGLKGTHFHDVYIDADTTAAYGSDHLSNGFSTALRDARGRWIGVISAHAGSRWFEVPIKETYSNLKKLGMNTSDVSLIAKDGTLLFEYASNPKEAGLDPARYDMKRLLKLNYAKAGFEPAKRLSEGKDGSGTFEDPISKEAYTTGFTPLRGPKFVESIGWGVMVRNSSRFNEGLAELNAFKTRIYWIMGILMGLSWIAAAFLSSSLSRKIAELARSLSERTRQVDSTAQSISGSSQNLSSSVSEQAASLQETASALEQIGSMIHSSSENAQRSLEASKKSHELAKAGRDSMDQLIGAMGEIKSGSEIILDRVDQGNAKITGIVQLIQEIGQKTKIINDIVFQTKLLSFNASVEAARAGEHGKGFSVVAEEVGNLAQMSGNAAKEISNLLESSTQRVEEIVRETRALVEQEARRGRDKVEKGTGVATHCRELLEQIFEGTGSVQAMMTEITGATRQQNQGIQEINKAMSQLDQATQQNSVIAQTGASGAVQLTTEAEQLSRLVNELQSAVFGEVLERTSSEPANVLKTVLKTEPKSEPKPEPQPEPKVEPKLTPSREAATKAEPAPASRATKAVDPGLGVPSADDPRFEDL